jgi:hypothetical protein
MAGDFFEDAREPCHLILCHARRNTGRQQIGMAALNGRLKTGVVLLCVLLLAGVFVCLRLAPSWPNVDPPPQPPADPLQSVDKRDLRLSNDAASKSGDFWLEQTAVLPQEITHAPADRCLLELYLTIDAQTLAGARVRWLPGKVLLEKTGAANSGGLQEITPLASADIPAPPLKGGEHVFGALWRGGELSLWDGERQLLAFKAGADLPRLDGPSAACANLTGIELGARRIVALQSIRFDDTFMRGAADSVWRPACGKWELTTQAFPERSANPFSLRIAFNNERVEDDKIYAQRMRDPQNGLGVELAHHEGTLNIQRITGGSAAAKAGLAEKDILLEIENTSVENIDPWTASNLITRRANWGKVRLKILRPGEKAPREILITPEPFRWGTPATSVLLDPVLPPQTIENNKVALIYAGEAGWSDYAVEAAMKPLGSGGGGIVFGLTSPRDYCVFRWRGPRGRTDAETGVYDKLQLVRVIDNRETLIAECNGGYRPYEFYRLGVDWNGSRVSCRVDGNKLLAADIPELKRGAIGLCALQGDPVFFDDLHVASDRALLAEFHLPQRVVNAIFANEDDMEQWANPALEWDRNVETGWAVHKQRFPGDQTVELNKPRFDDLTVKLQCNAAGACAGPVLTVRNGEAHIDAPGFEPAAQQVGPGPFKCVTLRATPGLIEADFDGRRITAKPDSSAPSLPRQNFSCSQVAILGLKNIGEPSATRITSSRMREHTFDASPTDWKVACGRWGLLNKWICDPRWSWFGGRTRSLAALWNKNIHSGDIAVDAHVSLMMQTEDAPYERPGDYNITICGDGENLDSGYTLIFGGDNNRWTRLYRKGALVAESTLEEHRVFSDAIRHPDKPDLHQRWFHLKLEKIGGKITFYRDDKPAFTFDDPQPLNEGRIAFWTMDNGMLLSRVRIAYDGMRPGPFESRRASLFEDARVINRFDGETQVSVERQRLPRQIEASLKASVEAFLPVSADAEPDAKAGKNADEADESTGYAVTNGIGGGTFALQWKTQVLDPEEQGLLRFAYRLEPGANVDLYMTESNGTNMDPRRQKTYRWRLSGPRESIEFAPLAGTVPNVIADGRWHTVQFDLQPSWREFWKRRGFNRASACRLRPFIGNADNHGYLLAGMNGNHAGARYGISDIKVFNPREFDKTAPKISRVIWPFDAEGDGCNITVCFDDAGGSGVEPESLAVSLNGAALPKNALSFDTPAQRLSINLLKLALPPFAEGQVFKLAITAHNDRAGNAGGAFAAEYTYHEAAALAAARPAAAPEISIQVANSASLPAGRALALEDAQTVKGGHVARLQTSSDAPAWALPGQRRSLQVVDVDDGSTFGFLLRNARFNIRAYPYLQIDYKIPPETPFNLLLADGDYATHALLLTDTGDGDDPNSHDILSRFGPPADFIADGTWRQTTVNLQPLRDALTPGNSEIRSLSFEDRGWRGNRRGMEYWIHRVTPLAAEKSGQIVFSWLTRDLTGSVDFASCIDDKPDTDPAGRQDVKNGETLAQSLLRRNATIRDGWLWLHVRVKNGAGVWSDAAHQKFHLDNSAPKLVRTEPADGARFAGQTLRLVFDEPHGIDLRSLSLQINGRVINGYDKGVSFDPATNTVSYNALSAGAPWGDNDPVNVELRGIDDLLGNKLAAPCKFSFQIDRSLDTQGPEIASIRFGPNLPDRNEHRQTQMETSFGLDFERHCGHFHAMRDCRFEWIDNPGQAAFGRRAAKFTALQDDGDVRIMLHKNAWHLDRFPALQFDYKADPGFKVDLLFEALGVWYCVAFTGDGLPPSDGKAVGRIAAVQADGAWRHASVDLRSLLAGARVALSARIINQVIFSAKGGSGCKRGSALVIDNFDMCGPDDGGNFEWTPQDDPSGIAGYSVKIDREPQTDCPMTMSQQGAVSSTGGGTGVHFLHVRARDPAGNWGRTKHFRIDFGKN